MNRALFLDRDGVINERLVDAYVTTPEEFKLIPGIIPILEFAQQKNLICVVISNQQGVGKGLMTLADLDVVHAHMNREFEEHGLQPLTKIHVCTSLREENDPRRKPNPGMLLEAIEEYGIIAGRSLFLGDMPSDATAGRAAGVQTALIGDYKASSASMVAPDHAEMLVELKKVFTD